MTDDRSPIFALADRHVTESAALDPITATFDGVLGFDDRLTDYSPAGIAARADHLRRTRAELRALAPLDDNDRVAAAFLDERLGVAIDADEAGEPYRAIANIAGPVVEIRQVFDLQPVDTPAEQEAALARLRGVPDTLAGFRDALEEGLRRDLPAARRQVAEAVEQSETFAGRRGAAPWFTTWIRSWAADADGSPGPEIAATAAAADSAYGEMAEWLAGTYAPRATDRDAVGAERYALLARLYLGADLDPAEAYAWGWDEVHRIVDEMARVADEILPGAGVHAVIDHLDADRGAGFATVDELAVWLQELIDSTIDRIDGTHFDIAPEIRACTAMIAPEGSAEAMYYTPPTEDFSRPGRTWYPRTDKGWYPTWGEVTVCNHEAVPGHHLQCGQAVLQKDRLSRFSRLAFVSGHGEGWALYAERLMDELGLLDPPARLGMLRDALFRALRVVVDIGLHLELRIPDGEAVGAGEVWTPALAEATFTAATRQDPAFIRSEVVRYLGLPGQAISYKLGERLWRELRDDARAEQGAAFDLKQFHMTALDLGPLGLDLLRDELLGALRTGG